MKIPRRTKHGAVRRIAPRSWRARAALQLGTCAAVFTFALRSAFAQAGSAGEPTEKPLDQAIEVATLNPCLERPALIDDVETFLERDLVDSAVFVKVGETEQVPWFSIRLGDGPATSRQFFELPADCGEMRRVVALSIALAIDALAPESSASSMERPRVFALAYGALSKSLPDGGLGFGGGASFRWALTRHFLPSLGVVALFASHESVGSEAPVHYDARLLAARVEGCLSFARTRVVEGFACVGPWLGAFTTSSSLENATGRTSFWGAAGAALELHVRLTEVIRLHLGADALVSLRRTKVQVLNSEGQVLAEQKVPEIAGMLRFGPVFAF